MDVEFRSVSAAELDAFTRTASAGFGEGPEWRERNAPFIEFAVDRTRAGFDGDAIVATSRNYPLELTLPGGEIVPAAGVSAVVVLPTHRRRGLFRHMMGWVLDDAVAREEPVAMLTASEGGLYGRFGFGVSTRSAHARIDKRDAHFAAPPPPGRLRMVSEDEARKVEPEVFERVRRARPGAISRPESWWPGEQYEPELGTRFDVLHEAPDGTIDGYACYGIREAWSAVSAAHRLHAREVVAATDDATHALWRFLLEIDLVGTVEHHHLPLDSPLPWLLESPRAVRVDVHDFVWTRLLDVPAALGARTYPVAGRVVLAVHDPVRPGGAADGAFAVEGGPDGAAVTRVRDEPDLACGIAAASTAWLGGVRWSELAAAGLVEERTPGALARADAMFASSPLPYPYTWF